MAQAIEADHRATFEEESMNDKLDTLSLPERMRKIALDIPDDMSNREYWLRTEILQWADAFDVLEQRVELKEALAEKEEA